MKNIFYLFLISAFVSCSKDVALPDAESQMPIDTIFPSSYLPIYPGSWWKYTHTGASDTLYGVTSSGYLLNNWQDGTNANDVHKKYLPAYISLSNSPNVFLDSNNTYVGYKFINFYGEIGNYNPFRQPYNTYLDETSSVGSSIDGSATQIGFFTRTIFARNDTEVVNNITYYPVIVTKYVSGLTPGPMNNVDYFYYAKNVGLIKKISIIPSNPPANDTVNIISYFINQ